MVRFRRTQKNMFAIQYEFFDVFIQRFRSFDFQ